MSTFDEFGLKIEIQKAIKELGFETPTPIQAETIPHLMSSDQDIIATAQTGREDSSVWIAGYPFSRWW